MRGVWIDINVFGNINHCYFCDKWKMQHFYIKNFFFPKPMGSLTHEIPPWLHHCTSCFKWCFTTSDGSLFYLW